MNKEEILEALSKYVLDSKEFIIISSASLVIQGFKDRTEDIDIATSDYLYYKLLKEYDCVLDKNIEI